MVTAKNLKFQEWNWSILATLHCNNNLRAWNLKALPAATFADLSDAQASSTYRDPGCLGLLDIRPKYRNMYVIPIINWIFTTILTQEDVFYGLFIHGLFIVL